MVPYSAAKVTEVVIDGVIAPVLGSTFAPPWTTRVSSPSPRCCAVSRFSPSPFEADAERNRFAHYGPPVEAACRSSPARRRFGATTR
jgi:hypothetical protein